MGADQRMRLIALLWRWSWFVLAQERYRGGVWTQLLGSPHFRIALLNGVRHVLSNDDPVRSNSLCVGFGGCIANVVFVKLTEKIEYTSCA